MPNPDCHIQREKLISGVNQTSLSGMTFYNGNNESPPQAPTPSDGLWDSWGTGRILGLIFMLLAGNFLFQILFYVVGGGLFLPALAGAGIGVFLPLLMMNRQSGLKIDRDLRLNNPGGMTLLIAGAMAIASLVPTSLLAELSLWMHPPDPDWIALFQDNLPHTPLGYAIAFVAVVLAAPLAEEIIFRGLLHRLASRQWGGVAATILSSLIFAIIHGEPWLFFGLMGVGLMLGVVYETTRSVTACWVAHAVHNGISLGLMISSGEVVIESDPITSQDWAWGGLSLLVLIILARWLTTRTTSTRAPNPDRY